MEHMEYLEVVAEEDVAHLQEKEKTYKGSWKQRGGVGAFMMLARKWDRLENMVQADGVMLPVGQEACKVVDKWDVIEHALATNGPDSVLEQIGDLRRYLLLVEAEVRARRNHAPMA